MDIQKMNYGPIFSVFGKNYKSGVEKFREHVPNGGILLVIYDDMQETLDNVGSLARRYNNLLPLDSLNLPSIITLGSKDERGIRQIYSDLPRGITPSNKPYQGEFDLVCLPADNLLDRAYTIVHIQDLKLGSNNNGGIVSGQRFIKDLKEFNPRPQYLIIWSTLQAGRYNSIRENPNILEIPQNIFPIFLAPKDSQQGAPGDYAPKLLQDIVSALSNETTPINSN